MRIQQIQMAMADQLPPTAATAQVETSNERKPMKQCSPSLISRFSSRTIFLASLLLGFNGSNSEAFANTFGLINNHNQIATAFRGGSSSLYDAPKGMQQGVKGVNGVNGVNGRKREIQTTIHKSVFSSDKLGDDITENMLIAANYVAETNLPTDVGHFRLRAYRVEEKMREILQKNHVGVEPCVIYSSNKPPFGDDSVAVRIHDQCFTSEVFRSQRCDCKQQLKMALEYINEHGGAIIYLQQEGRGIGLANKVAAYALQDDGMDTVDANVHLGFPEDCRQYGVVPSILEDMNISSIRLMTNNPRKTTQLASLGITVDDMIPMVVARSTVHNRKYLQTKKDRMNHKNFGDMLKMDSSINKRDVDDVVEESLLSMKQINNPGTNLTDGFSIAENFISAGEEMAAGAITSALFETDIDGDAVMQQTNDDTQEGVTADESGYCFGRESVEEAIAAVARGEIVVVVDDMDRENEGDFIMAADLCTPETMATIVRYSSGVICIGMEGERMDELKLPAMIAKNEDPKGTAFSVTVDAAPHHGITTGISAGERALTMNILSNPSSTAVDLVRPGHIFPLRAVERGVLDRDGHTEAAVDLSRLAGRHPSGVLCEIVSEEYPAEMARLPELKRFCKKHGFVLTSIVDIAQYRRDTEE